MRVRAVVRLLPLAALLALTASGAHAGEREWRELRKAYDAALSAVEGDRGRDPEATRKAHTALRDAAAKLLAESEQKATEHVLASGLSSRARAASEIAWDVLQRVRDPRATKDMIKAYEGASGTTRALLGHALRLNPSADVTTAFIKAMRDRDAEVRAAAARALGSRGAEARAGAEPALTRALKDDAVVVRWAAARSLETLTGARPEGFPEPASTVAGLLERYPYDRVALLFDTSLTAGERAFGDVLAADAAAQEGEGQGAEGAEEGAEAAPDQGGRRPPRRRGRAEAEEPAAAPPPVSAHDLAVKAAGEALKTFEEVPGVHLVRFGGPGTARSYQDGTPALKGDRAKADALAWLGRNPSDRGRDVLAALRRALELSPPPQLVHVFLTGGPDGRGAATTEEVREALADLLWGRDITIHVTAFVVPPAQEPTDERGRQARGEAEGAYAAFADVIAQAGAGRVTRLSLSRPAPEAAAAAPAPAAEEFPVDLTKPVTTRDLTTIRAGVREAIDKADVAAETLIEDVAACPDKKVTPLVLDALRTGGHGVQRAVVRGLAKNTEAGVTDALVQALKEERDPGLQLLLLRAVGRATTPTATAGLVDALGGLSADAARVAWSLLAARPAPELAPQQGRLARAARGLTGLADFHARTALALASGQPAPVATGLETGEGAFLPERFVAGGVAFVVDTHRDTETGLFFDPPAPPAAEPAADEQQGRGRRGRNEPRKDEPPAGPRLRPATALFAAVTEVERALKALGQAGAKGNVITTGGRSWQTQATTLDERQLGPATKFVTSLTSTPARDVWKGLKQAIEDPAVEVVHLLVSGTPVRSPGSGDAAELLQAVRQLNRDRAVTIHVVYVLKPSGPEGSAEAAARIDQLTAMDAVYRTLAEETGGRLIVRDALASLSVPRR